MLIKLWDKLTCLNSVITLEAVNKLEVKLGKIFTMAKTHHFTQGQKMASNPQKQAQDHHQQCHLDPHGTHQPRSILCRCSQCRQCSSHAQTVYGTAQNQAKEFQGLPER
jgi:hypothetical protein